MRATDADVAVDGGEWTVEVATEMRAATAAVPSQTQQLAEVSGLRWVGETPPAIAIAECEKAEGARAELWSCGAVELCYWWIDRQ